MSALANLIQQLRTCHQAGLDKRKLALGTATQLGCRINLLKGGIDPQVRLHFKYGIMKIASLINENVVGFIEDEYIARVLQVVDFRIEVASGNMNYRGDENLVSYLDPDAFVLGENPTEAQESALGALYTALNAVIGTDLSLEGIARNYGNLP